MLSTPLTMMSTWMPQKRKKASHVWSAMPTTDAPPASAFQPGHIVPNSASSAVPPIHVWMPNQPHATTARSIAGTFAPFVPKLARHSTGKETPYLVPACAFRIIGMRTTVLPSRMVSIACHQFIPRSTKPPASV